MIVLNDADVEKKIVKLCRIHRLTKKYTILAEEYSLDMKTYIQPIKEQKDAYEHIMRAFTRVYQLDEKENNNDENDDRYFIDSLDKAISHEFRAFYDTMDYISIVLRTLFYQCLKPYSYDEIIAVYPKYDEIKTQLTRIPHLIAVQRYQKDIGQEDPIKAADDYSAIIDMLFDDYKNIVENILSKMN